MPSHDKIPVFVNGSKIYFDHSDQTGRSIKERANIPLDHSLCEEDEEKCGCEGEKKELVVIKDEQAVHIESGRHFWSIAPVGGGVTVTINSKPYEFQNPNQTGKSLKEHAGIPLSDVLFRDRPIEDEVVPDDANVVLKCDEHFHSSPPANYGNSPPLSAGDVGYEAFELVQQPGGWSFLVIPQFRLPEGYRPSATRLLVKLPPLFPDAAPDMFWVTPQIRTESGAAPQGTSAEHLLGSEWQRFSWHLQPGAWKAGSSTLRDYMRCVRARFEMRN